MIQEYLAFAAGRDAGLSACCWARLPKPASIVRPAQGRRELSARAAESDVAMSSRWGCTIATTT